MYRVGEAYKYTDRRKVQRERVNLHIPAMRIFNKYKYDMFQNHIKSKVEKLLE